MAAERGNGQGHGAPGLSHQRRSHVLAVKDEKVDESFISLKECTVQLCKVDMHVVASKHPVVQVFAHPFLTRQLRLGIEQALIKTLHLVVTTINERVESIMEREDRLQESINNHPHHDDRQTRCFPVQVTKTVPMLAFQTQPAGPSPIPGDPAKVEVPAFCQAPWATKG
ncbi:hypothetical protein BGZ93_002453 [Podila epicladia]|nr:hypothetical protein BGZ93_002453 [Podila epicladia]